ncbi:MAG: MFS transporter [Patescibacteria group bacterium]|nr:MFS transporter [Patescibacteria group bacterium]
MDKKVIRLYLAIAFLFGLSHSFFFATYVVFLVSKGLDLLEVNLINCFFMAGVFLLEVPTGAYSDLVGRKRSFIIACFCWALSMFIYYFSSTFWIFVIAELIGALARAFCSGALEAWLVDSLKYYNFKGKLNDVFKKEQQLNQIGIMMGSLTGGYIGTIDLALPWLCTSIAMALVGVFCGLVIKEEYRSKSNGSFRVKAMWKTIIESVLYGVKEKSVFYIICFSVVFSFICQGPNMQWQIMFKNLGLDTGKLGWVFVGFCTFIFIGSQLSSWFLEITRSEKRAIVLSQLITVIGILVASQFSILGLVISSFFIHEAGRGIFRPLKQTYINKRIPSQQRSTILSFDSMMTMVGSVLGLVVSGWLAKNYSISASWFFSGIVLLIAIPVFLKMKNGE